MAKMVVTVGSVAHANRNEVSQDVVSFTDEVAVKPFPCTRLLLIQMNCHDDFKIKKSQIVYYRINVVCLSFH